MLKGTELMIFMEKNCFECIYYDYVQRKEGL